MHDVDVLRILPRSTWIVIIVTGLVTQAAMAWRAQGAADPAVLRPTAQAVMAASSYKVTIDQRMTAPAGAGMMTHTETSTVHMEIVVRRDGRLVRVYGVTTTRAGTAAPTVRAIVSTGPHVCQRFTASGPWICSLPLVMIAPYLDAIDPVRMLTGTASQLRLSAAAIRRVRGHRCKGYRFTLSDGAAGSTAHGSLWLDPATARPVEVEMVSSPSDTSRSASITAQQSVWSRWNDPALSIPAVHAS